LNNKNKFRKIKLFTIGTIAIFFAVIISYLIDRYSYANEQPFFSVNKINQNDILTVGIIGDSWVARKKLDSLLHQELLKIGLPNRIISSGNIGAKSKLIYQNLFKNEDVEHSSKFIIESHPEYCIVIAGVNDSSSQIGKNYYAFHMLQIINTLLHYEIKPIIVSLPEFDIEKTIDKMNILLKARSIISAMVNNNGIIDNINTYRQCLKSELIKNKLNDSILMVDFDNVCADHVNCKNLYIDSAHLSFSGNKKLCEIIAYELKMKEKKP